MPQWLALGRVHSGGRESYPLLVIGRAPGDREIVHSQERHNELCGRTVKGLNRELCLAAYGAPVGEQVRSPDPLINPMGNVVVDRFGTDNGGMVFLGAPLDPGIVYSGSLYVPSEGEPILRTRVLDGRDPRFGQYSKAIQGALN